MSAPLRLTAPDLKRLATALNRLTEITRETGIRFDGYSAVTVRVAGDVYLDVNWDETDGYVIDDRSGS